MVWSIDFTGEVGEVIELPPSNPIPFQHPYCCLRRARGRASRRFHIPGAVNPQESWSRLHDHPCLRHRCCKRTIHPFGLLQGSRCHQTSILPPLRRRCCYGPCTVGHGPSFLKNGVFSKPGRVCIVAVVGTGEVKGDSGRDHKEEEEDRSEGDEGGGTVG